MPIDELPVIYGFNNGGPSDFLSAVLISEDGEGLGGHCCSHESYMPHDLGILEGTRPDRHEGFKKYYPNGYKMEFVSHAEFKNHTKLKHACELNEKEKPNIDDPDPIQEGKEVEHDTQG